jgi:hypothetical protein
LKNALYLTTRHSFNASFNFALALVDHDLRKFIASFRILCQKDKHSERSAAWDRRSMLSLHAACS